MRPFVRSSVCVALPVLDDHPSSYVVRDFARALVREGVRPIRLRRGVGTALTRLRTQPPSFSRRLVIVPLMGVRPDVLAAAGLHGRPVPFCWDVWEPQWGIWADLLAAVGAPLVVTTSRQSARYLRGVLSSSVVEHLPEATNVRRYRSGGHLADRSTDVLELGRRNPRWHEAVKAAAESRGLKHLYESVPGRFVFPDEESLIAGLAESKISVCFPSDVTHPQRAGSVSTLTSRYLESMASRCLILGHAPDELCDLLGFNPVVKAEIDQPWSQLESVLGAIRTYQHQVDEASEMVRLVGSWECRARQLLSLISEL